MKSKVRLAIVLLLLVGLPACNRTDDKGTEDKDGKNAGGRVAIDRSTPENAVQSFQAAMAQADWSSAFQCLTPESQELVLALGLGLVQIERMPNPTEANVTKRKAWEAIAKRHGLDLNARSGNPLAKITDKAALFREAVEWAKKYSPHGTKPFDDLMKPMLEASFSEFKTTGESATARSQGKPPITVHFKRTGEDWYVDVTKSMPQPK